MKAMLMKIAARVHMFLTTVKKSVRGNPMDSECIGLCKALNSLSGIETIESCCGHGENPFHIWFLADDLEALPPLLYWFESCHCGFLGWQVIARTDCAMSPVTFKVEGPVGEQGYVEANKIAEVIMTWCLTR